MDVSSVKSKNIAETAGGAKSNKSTAEELIGNFSAAVAERMKQSGQGVAERSQTGMVSSLTAKSDVQASVQKDPYQAEPAVREAAAPRERSEAPETSSDDYVTPVEARDNAPRDNAQQDTARTDQGDVDHDGGAQNQDRASSEDQSAQSQGDQSDAQGAETADADGSAQDTAAVSDQGTSGTGSEELTAVTEAVQIASVAASDTTQKQTVSTDGVKTQETVQQTQGATVSQNTGENQGEQDVVDQGLTKKDGKANAQQQTQAATGPKVDGNHSLNQDASVKQQQAADIASKVGSDQKLDVTVNVTKQSEKLVSQPTANLGAQAAMSEDGDTTLQTTSQTAAKGPVTGQQAAANHSLGNQAGQQGQDGQQQAQQNMQAAIAEASKNAAASESKSQGAAQAANHASANSAVKVGGTEGLAGQQGAAQSNATQAPQTPANMQKAQANPQAQHRGAVTEQVNVQITKAIAEGMDKINIQLRPAHLGRVDIQLEMASDGRVSAVVTADNKDTLDLLKQDSRELERALREAGLQMNSNDLSFQMRGEGQHGHGDGSQMAGGSGGALSNEPTLDELLAANTQRPDIISEDRVDITA